MGKTVEILDGKAELCRSIMEALPDWFAEAAVIETSAAAIEDLPEFGYIEDDAGRHLLAEAEKFSRSAGARLLTVKTPAPRGRDEPQFEATRNFYDRNGFIHEEVFPILWHEDHPCLFLVKPLERLQ